ncbi:MAG TPA: type II secretion system F family protein [Candidatus Nitrosopolaris sp.]|nr:type II secretion system F family protein [Candidatus Nitrosopolaris sp.]
MELVLPTAVTFAVVTVLILSLYHAITAEPVVSQRVRRLLGVQATRPEPARREPGLLQRMLVAVGRAAGGAEPRLVKRLGVAGLYGPDLTLTFVGARILLSFGPALMVLVPEVALGRPLAPAVSFAALAWAGGSLATGLWVQRRANRRIAQIRASLPDALDLMVVCLEAGLGLNATIARIGDERSTLDDALGQEFGQATLELRSGRSREDVLRALGERNGVDELRSLAGLIIQSDRLGASMAKTLRAHADVVRTKRRQRAEEAARKLPIRMLFPLALFILPALFMVTTGPAVLKLRELGTIMRRP